MFSRDGRRSLRLPLHIMFVLVICASTLAVHFLAEELSPGHRQFPFEMAGQWGHAYPIHEHAEDDFVFSLPGRSYQEGLLVPALLIIPIHFASISISPLLPPPNA